jgi:hypothetical protein
MGTRVDAVVGLACLPAAIAPAERPAHFALIRQLFGALVQERAQLPNGYAYRFQSDALELVARFVANERKCCPFLCFELLIGAESGPLWLRMTGPEGTHAVLDAELAIAAGPRQAVGLDSV